MGGMFFRCHIPTQEEIISPPFSLISRVLTKVLIYQASLIVITPAWQTKFCYKISLKTFSFSPDPKPLERFDQRTLSFSWKRKDATPGMDSFKQKLFTKVISKESASLISDPRRSGAVSHYESAWRKCGNSCRWRQIIPIKSPLNFILDFWTQCYRVGFQINTTANFRLAIFAYHDPIGRASIESNARVSDLMSVITDTHNQNIFLPGMQRA